MTDKTGGRGFPVPPIPEHYAPCGMTLRDYFAAHAPSVTGDFQRASWKQQQVVEDNGMKRVVVVDARESAEQWEARWRFAYADAMIKAREI